MNLRRICSALIEILYQYFSGGTEENRKISVRISDISAEI
jgi:hypothetical protein